MDIQQTKYYFKGFPISSDTQQPLKYTEVRSGVSFAFLDAFILHGSSISASTQHPHNTNQQAIEKLRSFTNNSLDKVTERWLINLDLVQDAYKVAQKVRGFFATRPITFRRNANPDNSYLLEIWVETSDDLDLEIETLHRFDVEWWINQSKDLKNKIIVLLK